MESGLAKMNKKGLRKMQGGAANRKGSAWWVARLLTAAAWAARTTVHLGLGAVLLLASACSRELSRGDITILVVDASGGTLGYANQGSAAAGAEPAEGAVYLVDNRLPLAALGRTQPDWWRVPLDATLVARFQRTEGIFTAIVDINGDGRTDAFARDVTSGTSRTIVVSGINPRDDGAFLVAATDRDAYAHGDTIRIRIQGWLPATEPVHAEIWNAWNGGFEFWASAPVTVGGDVDFTVSTVVPDDWPQTSTATGSDYFAHPATAAALFAGTRFELVGESDGGGGPAPTAPSIEIAGGAEYTTDLNVSVAVAANGAAFYRLANAATALEGRPWADLANGATTVTWLLAAGPDGVRTVYAQFAGSLGVPSDAVSDVIVLDTTPPQILALTVAPNIARAGSAIEIGFQLSEAVETLSLTLAATEVGDVSCDTELQCTATYIVQGDEGEGENLVLVRATDAAGLIGEAAAEVEFDFTAPNTFLLTPLPSDPTTATTAAFNLASDDAEAGFECSLDGGEWTVCGSTTTFNNLSDGSHVFAARAVDVAGNADLSPVVFTWTVDTTPPLTTLLSFPASPTSAAVHRFEFTANEAATFQCMVVGLGVPFDTCTSPKLYGGLVEGLYTFHIFATDLAGNVEPVSHTVDWVVDFTPATAYALAVSPAYAALATTVEIEFSVGEALANDPLVWVGGVPAILATLVGDTYTYEYVVTGGETEGTAPVLVHIRDDAFNLTVLEGEVVFDFTPPDTTLESPLPQAYTNVTFPSFSFSANETVQGFDCRLIPVDVGFTPCAPPYQVTSLADGAYTFTVRAVDLAGNADTTPASWAFTVDTVPPAAPVAALLEIIGQPTGTPDELRGLAGAIDVPDAVGVYVYANTELTFLGAFTDTINGDGSFAPFPFGDNFSDGHQQIYVTAKDLAGNESHYTTLINFSAPPKVSPGLIFITYAPDAHGNSIANPGDAIQVTWDNSSSGNDNPGVTAVWVRIPGAGLGPVQANAVSQSWTATFPLATGSIDGSFPVQVSAVNAIGLESGWVTGLVFADIDNDPPAAPTDLTLNYYLDPSNNAVFELSWLPITDTDLAEYVAAYGTTPGTPNAFPAVGVSTSALTTDVQVCFDYYGSVFAKDDADNVSSTPVTGPLLLTVFPPDFAAWGGVKQFYSYTFSPSQSGQGVNHFRMWFEAVTAITNTADPRTWMGSTTDGSVVSPIDVGELTTSVAPFFEGTAYAVAVSAFASNGSNTCFSDFAVTEVVETLGFVGVGGSVVGGGVCVGNCDAVGSGGEQFFGGLGFSIAAVSDVVGGDGIADLLVGVPGETRTVLMSGNNLTQATVRTDYFISQDVIGGGPSLAAIGDINGDGFGDVAVGSPLESTGGLNLVGVVRVYSGSATTPIRVVTGTVEGDQAGYAIAGIGDVVPTGALDGVPDILVGAFGCLTFTCADTHSPGRAYVVSGADGSIARTHTGPWPASFFGIAVTGGYDLNGDMVPDYVIGAPGHLGLGSPLGTVRIYSGADGTLLDSVDDAFALSLLDRFTYRFGASVVLLQRSPGGAPLLVVGSPSRLDFVDGYVYAFDFNADGTVNHAATLPRYYSLSERYLGIAAMAAGDIDGNGLNEVIVGSPNIPLSSGFGGGNAFLYEFPSGVDGKLRWQVRGGLFDGAIGYAFDHIRDLNSDGLDELVIGAPGSFTDGLYGAGLIYIMSTKDP